MPDMTSFLAGRQNDNGLKLRPLSFFRVSEDGPEATESVVSVPRPSYSGKRKLRPQSLWSNNLYSSEESGRRRVKRTCQFAARVLPLARPFSFSASANEVNASCAWGSTERRWRFASATPNTASSTRNRIMALMKVRSF